MGEDSSFPNLSWQGVAESESLANSLSEGFDIGIDLIGIQKTGKGRNIIKGVAFANADASANADALANSETEFIAFAFANAEANAAASSFAIGLNNQSKLNTGKGKDVVRGIAFANSLAEANSRAEASAVSDFGLAVAVANNRATAFANAFAVGINNAEEAVINTKSGRDVINGQAFAQANASAVAETTAFVAGILAESEVNVDSIDVSTALTVLGINNNGKLRTGRGGDRIKGVAIGNGAAWAATANTIADAIADVAAAANANVNASATISTVAIGINNNGTGSNQGWIITGRGNDQVVGIGITDDASAVSAAAATANATGSDSSSNAVVVNSVSAEPIEAIGINNIDGLINLGGGRDTIKAYGNTFGLFGGDVQLGRGNDVLYAGIIDQHSGSTGRVESFFEDQTGALENVKVSAGNGNDRFILYSVFGDNAYLDGGQGFDRLQLPGHIDQYPITVGSLHKKALTIQRDGLTLAVEDVEQFTIGQQTVSFNDFV